MPYASNADLPASVRDRYSDRCQSVYRDAFNRELERHGDEQRAFAVGETAAKNCADSTKAAAVKFVGPDTLEGLAIPFGGVFDHPGEGLKNKDWDGEDFGPDTDYCFDWFGKSGRPALFEHGFDRALKAAVVGRQIDYEVREEGIWAQTQLDRAAKFRRAIDQLVEQGVLGYSSGAMPHLVTKSAEGHITRWPWVELSLTPIPAAADLAQVHYVKAASLIDYLAGLEDVEATDGTKAGRVLSAATRSRLSNHPAALRQLADDLDELLASADAPKDEGKSAAEYTSARLEAERTYARLTGARSH